MPDSAFEAWYGEVEGFALRAERLTGPKDELQAAFEAGVEAERERCAKIAETDADWSAFQRRRALAFHKIGADKPNIA